MSTPCILVFAGPNGSGKSTITGQYPPEGVYVNADEIERVKKCSSKEAAIIAEQTREHLLSNLQSFTMETVLSTPRNINLLKRAKDAGYYIMGVYVTTAHPSINVSRCHYRYDNGGHGVGSDPDKPVDDDKIIQRYRRAMRLIPELCKVCNRLLIFDNSLDKSEEQVSLIAEICNDKVYIYPCAVWKEEQIISLLQGTYNPDLL